MGTLTQAGGERVQNSPLLTLNAVTMSRLLVVVALIAAMVTLTVALPPKVSAKDIKLMRQSEINMTESVGDEVEYEEKIDYGNSRVKISEKDAKAKNALPECAKYSAGCGRCTAWSSVPNMQCGYCASTKECLNGNQFGPATSNCTSWSWGFCPGEPCNVYDTCFQCVTDPFCGWCQSLAQCMEGTATGPLFGQCAAWEPFASSQSCSSPPPEPDEFQTSDYSAASKLIDPYAL